MYVVCVYMCTQQTACVFVNDVLRLNVFGYTERGYVPEIPSVENGVFFYIYVTLCAR